ncbi:MAG: hypothetical protein AMXMBFR84_39480 [Candidatus Hydrogenedentota bacterium]
MTKTNSIQWHLALLNVVLALVAMFNADAQDATHSIVEGKAELVAARVFSGTIHGWHSNRLLKIDGRLYACATIRNPNPEKPDWPYSHPGAFYRREDNGTWNEVGTLPYPPYMMLAGPDKRVWITGSTDYANVHINRTKEPVDFSSIEEVHTGTNAYMGAAISPEGNFLTLYAETAEMQYGKPNAIIAAFFDAADGTWHTSRMETPEGRYGYEGILLTGKRAIAVLNSALYDPDHSDGEGTKYSWRHVRLASCEDLTVGNWKNIGWLMPLDGRTALQDMIPDGNGGAYVSYAHASAASHEELLKTPGTPHYIAHIAPNLAVDSHETGLNPGLSRMLMAGDGRMFLIGRPVAGDLHLWQLDTSTFKALREWTVSNSANLEAYVVHALCPARFGGEDAGDTVHLLSVKYLKDESGQSTQEAELWHAYFELPER